jgi:L-ascorbate metabolism protein UlaG (beta-lactamase superfamily)
MKSLMDHEGLKIQWLNHHASFLIVAKNGTRIVIDPWENKEAEAADIVLITHPHYDHFNADDIRKIRSNHTVVIAPPECKDQLSGAFKTATPGTKINQDGIIIEAVPSYNINKFKSPGQPFHSRANKWNGYVINMDGTLVYHAGDTDFIDEMEWLQNIEIALVPVGGIYTMTASEAAEACNAIKPKLAVPMHWGKIVGTRKDADTFAGLFKGNSKILDA